MLQTPQISPSFLQDGLNAPDVSTDYQELNEKMAKSFRMTLEHVSQTEEEQENTYLSGYSARACPQIAFCKMPSQFASDFMLDLGGVVGYIDQIQRKIWGEVGRYIAGINLGTCSRAVIHGDWMEWSITELELPISCLS